MLVFVQTRKQKRKSYSFTKGTGTVTQYIVNITVINTDNHNYCIIMSNLTNDRDTETKILNDCQFTINLAINRSFRLQTYHISHL